MRQWRLIEDEHSSGARNMAVDEAILEAVSARTQPPTVRFYGWDPFCLSLGYGQRIRDADEAALHGYGYDLVRRPTGGKAILHGDELTYSLALPIDHPLAQGDVIASYRRISEALTAMLVRLGMSPRSEKQATGNRGLGPVCFEVPSHYEITVNGKKLIGSAQVRHKEGILQHGSIPIEADMTHIFDVLHFADERERTDGKVHILERATTLQREIANVGYTTVAQALAQSITETFAVDLQAVTLSPHEAHRAQELQREKYENDEWTRKR